MRGAVAVVDGGAGAVEGLNRRSVAKLAEPLPALVLFGHGPAVRDPGLFTHSVRKLAD